jgi:hypothetical protein
LERGRSRAHFNLKKKKERKKEREEIAQLQYKLYLMISSGNIDAHDLSVT